METRKLTAENSITANNLINEEVEEYSNIGIPENLYIIGTVNMDQTTFQFSKKVLDRASAIEFNQVDLNFDFDNFININKVEPKIIHREEDFTRRNVLIGTLKMWNN
jgi:5-methylcytosine-specific restriction endonuclease McrBC GTP-binding regulatory subunit McrB